MPRRVHLLHIRYYSTYGEYENQDTGRDIEAKASESISGGHRTSKEQPCDLGVNRDKGVRLTCAPRKEPVQDNVEHHENRHYANSSFPHAGVSLVALKVYGKELLGPVAFE
eukprot:TRINITY_DN13273_c0_g3_i4.p3 TRINITY_DN13273_c0_g3~~TRINITY_DN13273_c0_g3_i4.p3  ORF type:complete len:111 (-),score=4.65 TRINITY_DN13273_c0_g3_i4:167-499(-)